MGYHISMPSLSVVIPTHERAEILKLCLRRLEEQTIADEIEVIVVSDVHDAKTASLFQKEIWRIPLQFFEIEKCQQGVARNRGVEKASSPFVLFIGDDILLENDACERHLAAHYSLRQEKTAVLGFTTWDPVLDISPVMRWLEKSGWQFGYPLIRKYTHDFVPAELQERFSYTSQISVPTVTARHLPFREDVSLYGWEDIEWGQRLKETGIRLYYEPDAKALHHHHLSLEQSLERMEILGMSLVSMARRIPTFKKKLARRRVLALHMLASLPTMSGMHRRAFLRGIAQGKQSS